LAGDGRKRYKTAEAKELFIELVTQGYVQTDALRAVGRTENTYYDWRERDSDFRARVDSVRAARSRGHALPVPDFPEFCERYLGQPLYWHQLQWFDLLEGREPRDVHPSQVYEKGDPKFLLVNTPPEHGKTSTLSVNYATWRIVRDPNVKIMFVSKTQDMAKQIMWGVKNRLTHPNYLQMQLDFGPPGGWKSDADMWAADKVYLGIERDSKDKDPTMRAVGIGGQIYGSRVDLTFVDDAVVLSNAHEYEKQIRWLQQEVLTRGNPMSILLVIGTRVDPVDLYAELRNPDRYPSGESPWTYLSQPAVLEFADDPKDWHTLWPRAQEPWPGALDRPDSEGQYPRWNGLYLRKRRGLLAPRTWALAYQQASIAEDAVFRQEVVRAAVQGTRQPGVMSKGAPGHRENGMDGLYVIGSMDPAMVGNTGVIVMGVDRHARMRYVLQVLNQPRATPTWIRETIKSLTEAYKIHEWRIEKNGFQSYLTQDPELHEWLGALGVRIHEHHTGKNKWDVDYGVASLAPVFENGFMSLPATHKVESCKQLVEQLITWAPETKSKTDLVMALWFAEVRAREIINANSQAKGQHNFVRNRWATRRQKGLQVVVNLNDLAITARG
jgi:hypothetical protein